MDATTAPVALDLGWLVVCLPAIDLELSMDFYRRVGFELVGGQPDNGWAVMGAGNSELNPMRGLDNVWLNFRGADIAALRTELEARGLGPRDGGEFDTTKWPAELWHAADGTALPAAGSGDFFLDDPNGNTIYFDTVPIERVRQAAGEPQASVGFDGHWREGQPRLGSFELALKVTDLTRSREFYSRLGLAELSSEEKSVLLGSPDHPRTRLRLWRSEIPGVVLRFTHADTAILEHFSANALVAEQHDGKAVLSSPDGHRLKFLFSS